jgi:hypothetical protein
MADTLLFRGGTSASIDVANVQSREIVIDTDTDQIVSGPSRKKTVMEDSSGNVSIDGSITVDGSGTFATAVGIGTATPGEILHIRSATEATIRLDNTSSSSRQGYITTTNAGDMEFRARANTSDGSFVFYGYGGLVDRERLRITSTGSITAAGDVKIGGLLPSAPNITLAADGSITTASRIQAGGVWSNDDSSQIRALIGANVGQLSIKGSASAGNSSSAIGVYKGGNGSGDLVFNVQYDGSINAAGNVTVADYDSTDATARGSRVGNGTVSVQRPESQASPGSQATFNSFLGTVPKAQIFADGSITAAGDVKIGGTLPAAPNISLNADGSGTFAGTVLSQNLLYAAKENTYVYPGGSGMSRNDLRDNATLRLANNDTTTQGTASIVAIQGKGSNSNSGYSFLSFVTPSNTGGNYISLASSIQGDTTADEVLIIESSGTTKIGGTLPSSPNISLNANGSASFAGTVTADAFQLTDGTPVTRGITALQALKTAAAAATDFASLQAAIATALADI